MQRRELLAVHKGKGVADILGATGAPNTMHIILRMFGDIVIDDVAHAGNVESAGCDIRRHHHFVLAALESFQCFDSFPLGAVGMQYRDGMLSDF